VAKDLSIPKTRRLLQTAQFDRVRKEGKVWRGDLISLAVVTSSDATEGMRAGIIASRRVGGAVVRNRVRRRLREIVRKHQHSLANGLWLVVIASARAGRTPFHQLEDEWLRLARRASILAP
jgi:ribonuclease P protein component